MKTIVVFTDQPLVLHLLKSSEHTRNMEEVYPHQDALAP